MIKNAPDGRPRTKRAERRSRQTQLRMRAALVLVGALVSTVVLATPAHASTPRPEGVASPLYAKLAAVAVQVAHVSPRRNEGAISLVRRVCGTTKGWQAKIGGVTYLYLGKTYTVDCSATGVRPVQQQASRAAARSGGDWTHPLANHGACGSRDFGMHRHPILGGTKMHQGQDMRAGSGVDILAVAPGTIIRAGTRSGWGLSIEIRHANGDTSFYAHASRLLRTGGTVQRGEHIAEVGSTGLSTAPHLHFGATRGGAWKDPRTIASSHGLDLC